MLALRSLHIPGTGIFRRAFSSAAVAEKLSKEDVKNASVDKKLLLKLRRRTGYGFVNCKKAIIIHGEDLQAAEAYLHKLAQEEGWNRAAKMQGRKARQGLIGVMADGSSSFGTLVEVNCETDFVSRNEMFRSLVCAVSHCAMAMKGNDTDSNRSIIDVTQLNQQIIPSYEVSDPELAPPVGDSLSNYLNFLLGKLGEKIEITRAINLLFQDESVKVAGYAHPRSEVIYPGGVKMGDYATVVAMRETPAALELPNRIPLSFLGTQLGQHIIGMSPSELGTLLTEEEIEEEAAKALKKSKKKKRKGKAEEVDEGEEDSSDTSFDMSEQRLLRQQFLINPDITVGDFVTGNGVEIVDFLRYNTGETHVEED